jgi:fimbrial chaperone protein
MLGNWVDAQAAVNELKGTYFESTRVIYPEEARQGESIVLNNNSDKDFLAQAYIADARPDNGALAGVSGDFIVTPPLNRLDRHETLALRVLRTGGQLPADRESLFYLTVSLIPSESAPAAQDKNNKVKFLTALAVKVFWRPQALVKKDAVVYAAGKLKASISGKELVLSNPSPYWITLRTLSVGGASVRPEELARMIPPRGEQRWTLPVGMRQEKMVPVVWKAITENGYDTDTVFTPILFPAVSDKQSK